MKVYVSGAFDHRDELRGLAAALEARGHTCTSNWLYEPPLVFGGTEHAAWEYRARANEDAQDIRRSDALVEVTLWPSTTGGRHWEAGGAYMLDKRLFMVGPVENTFHYLSAVEQFPTIADFLLFMETQH